MSTFTNPIIITVCIFLATVITTAIIAKWLNIRKKKSVRMIPLACHNLNSKNIKRVEFFVVEILGAPMVTRYTTYKDGMIRKGHLKFPNHFEYYYKHNYTQPGFKILDLNALAKVQYYLDVEKELKLVRSL